MWHHNKVNSLELSKWRFPVHKKPILKVDRLVCQHNWTKIHLLSCPRVVTIWKHGSSWSVERSFSEIIYILLILLIAGRALNDLSEVCSVRCVRKGKVIIADPYYPVWQEYSVLPDIATVSHDSGPIGSRRPWSLMQLLFWMLSFDTLYIQVCSLVLKSVILNDYWLQIKLSPRGIIKLPLILNMAVLEPNS